MHVQIHTYTLSDDRLGWGLLPARPNEPSCSAPLIKATYIFVILSAFFKKLYLSSQALLFIM